MNGLVLQKTYPGEFPRPSAEVCYLEKEKLLIVSTPWGGKDALKEMNTTLKDCYSASATDREATSPFQKLPNLSPLENSLRTATLIANSVICRKFNFNTYASACETLIVGFNQAEMTWVQIGQPHLLLLRGNRLSPLAVALDLSLDYACETPLPTRLLGVDSQMEVEVKSLAVREDDILLMICRQTLSQSLFQIQFDNQNPDQVLEKAFDAMAKEDIQAPFWIGVFK